MLFNSYLFLLFALVAFGGYFAISNWRLRKLFLLAMSYIFYAAWIAPYLILIIFSTLIDFYAAGRMAKSTSEKARTFYLIFSLIGNLGVLSYFKYGGFVLENFTSALRLAGVEYEPMPWNVLLPIGISFYTFQTLSYTIDVYRGRLQPTKSLLDFALFVTFFPQLVAGPIVRARNFLPQLVSAPKVTIDRFGWGLGLIIFGLFEKVAVSDGIAAPVVNEVFSQSGILPAKTVLISWVAFTVQILCDFSGYSLMAIGLAACLGFKLPENFRAPYAALGCQDFWNRWHISMSGWFRDYLYAPLRKLGNRRSFSNVLWAQSITFILIGLWHGASWTFVLWGVYNAVAICLEIVLKRAIGHWEIWKRKFMVPVFWFMTYCFFAAGLAMFRAETLQTAWNMYLSFFLTTTTGYTVSMVDQALIGVCIVTIVLAHFYLRKRSFETEVRALPFSVRTFALTGMILAIALVGRSNEAFIYFQF